MNHDLGSRRRSAIVVAGRRVRLAVLLIWRRFSLAREISEPDRAQLQRDWIERGLAAERFHDALLRESKSLTTPDSPHAPV